MDSLALLIAPLGSWGLYTLRLRHVHQEGEEYAGGNFINSADGIDNQRLKRLIELCLRTQSDNLYEKAGHGFNNKKAFFSKADKTTQKYIASYVDQRITEAIAIATDLGVHVFFAPRPGEWLKQKDELHFDAHPLKLHAAFTKTDNGIDYRLTLGNGLIPSAHDTKIICNNPSLLAIDHNLRQLDEGLGGRLLKPFLTGEVYHIPASFQANYFRQFILKIVKKIDISSNGFDIDNQHPTGKAMLSLQSTFDGHYMLELQFVYDTVTFTAADHREKSVTFYDDGTDVAFRCIWRNREWEASVTRLLDEQLHRPQEASLQEMLTWLTINETTLEQNNIAVTQHTTHHYVIGEVKKVYDNHWTGDWFELHVTLLFPDGTSIPLTDFRDAIINGDHEVRLPSGNWFIIPDEWFEQYSAAMLFGHAKDNHTLTFHRSQVTVLPTDDQGAFPQTAAPSPAPIVKDLQPPQQLKATLRPYQLEGYRWMVSHLQANNGCLLGDDMGLGKTVQTIAVILYHFQVSDANDSTPPQPSHKDTVAASSERKVAGPTQLTLFSIEEMSGKTEVRPSQPVSTPSILPSSANHQPVLVVAPSSVIFNWRDELRRFAPSLSVVTYTGNGHQRAQKQRKLSKADIVLTSYPILRNDIAVLCRHHYAIAVYDEAHTFRNNDSQLYQAVQRLHTDCSIALTGTPMVNALDELWALMSILNPGLLGDYETFQDQFIHPINANLQDEHTAILRKLVAPYFLRRLRNDVLDSLPERQDEMIWCEMTDSQTAYYAEEINKMRSLLMDSENDNNQIMVLNALMRLRQLACCPKMMEIAADSGKMYEVFYRLEQLRGTDHKVLLFSEFTSFLDVIAEEMKRRGWTYDMLTGKSRNREAIVKHFQQTPSCQFFLVSLKAGGEGLNLTEADYVFLLDPWWNHAAEEQAIARAHRTGQRRPVMVYRFITQGSLEEQILKVQDEKDELIKAILQQEGQGAVIDSIGNERPPAIV